MIKVAPNPRTGGGGARGDAGGDGDDPNRNTAFWIEKQKQFMVTMAHSPHAVYFKKPI